MTPPSHNRRPPDEDGDRPSVVGNAVHDVYERGTHGQLYVVPYEHNATPPKQRRPYVPCTYEELDDPSLTAEALVLLLRIRRIADRDQNDGVIPRAKVKGLRAEYGYRRPRWNGAFETLLKTGRVLEGPVSIFDRLFVLCCRTRGEREVRNQQLREAQRTHRDKKSSDDEGE